MGVGPLAGAGVGCDTAVREGHRKYGAIPRACRAPVDSLRPACAVEGVSFVWQDGLAVTATVRRPSPVKFKGENTRC